MKKYLLPLVLMATPAGAEMPDLLICSGAEPFWTLDIGPSRANFIDPELPQPIAYERVHETVAIGRVWPVAITLLARSDTAVVLIAERSCDDTMSDQNYSHSIDMLTQRRGQPVVLTGCCLAKPE